MIRKTRLVKPAESHGWTDAQLSAFGELFPGFPQWYREHYDERGNVRVREQERESERE